MRALERKGGDIQSRWGCKVRLPTKPDGVEAGRIGSEKECQGGMVVVGVETKIKSPHNGDGKILIPWC